MGVAGDGYGEVCGVLKDGGLTLMNVKLGWSLISSKLLTVAQYSNYNTLHSSKAIQPVSAQLLSVCRQFVRVVRADC